VGSVGRVLEAHRQTGSAVRLEWGRTGGRAISRGCDVAVVVDVLSFWGRRPHGAPGLRERPRADRRGLSRRRRRRGGAGRQRVRSRAARRDVRRRL